MKKEEIMAAIQQLKDTVANVQCEIAALEELVVNENHQEETPNETPVVNEVSNTLIVKGTEELEYNEDFPSSAEITEYNEELDMAMDAYYFEHKEEFEDTILPAPPAEIHIDVVDEKPKATPKAKEAAPDEETVIACQILSKLPDFYKGTCRGITLQKQWHDNSDKINPRTQRGYEKLHINRYKVVITAEDIESKPIGTIIVHWNTLAEWHPFLISRGINKHKETDNPHTNWMPEVVSLCID